MATILNFLFLKHQFNRSNFTYRIISSSIAFICSHSYKEKKIRVGLNSIMLPITNDKEVVDRSSSSESTCQIGPLSQKEPNRVMTGEVGNAIKFANVTCR